MSLTSSFSNALSGLSASSRAAQVVSSNIANSLTEGYASRSIALSSQSLAGNGAGVKIEGIFRNVDPALIADRRIAQAELGNASVLSEFFEQLEQSIGNPENADSLNQHISALETSLIEAASRPDSPTRLNAVLTASKNIAAKFNGISDQIQDMRMTADKEISAQVNFLNDSLQKIEELNDQILAQTANGRDATALMDQRQVMIDNVAEIVPLKEVARDKNAVALFTDGGAILLDGRAGEFQFSSVSTIVPQMTLSSGALSGISLNGNPIDTTSDRNSLAGGSLSSLFTTRDELSVNAQNDLDSIARNLIDRFSDSTVDNTSVGGVFTDAGVIFDPTNEVGLSSRLAIAPQVDPVQGGETWRLRDGLGAINLGEVGDASKLQAMVDILRAPVFPASGSFSSVSRSLIDLTADFLSSVGSQKHSIERDMSFAVAKTTALQFQEKSAGVDSDQEMQKLLQIERSYAANAKVIQSLDQMLDLLMGI